MKNKNEQQKKERSAIEQTEAALRLQAKMKLHFTNAAKQDNNSQAKDEKPHQFH